MEYLCEDCCANLRIRFFGMAENAVGRKFCRLCKGNHCDPLHIDENNVSIAANRDNKVSHSIGRRREAKLKSEAREKILARAKKLNW